MEQNHLSLKNDHHQKLELTQKQDKILNCHRLEGTKQTVEGASR